MRRRLRTTRGLFASNRANERGQALALTLATMFTLSIVVVTVILYAGSTTKSAYDSGGKESAYNLAEAGLNDAYGAISVAGSDTTGIPTDPSTNVQTLGNDATES